MEIILVNTPPKFGDNYWTDRIHKMLWESNTQYDSITVITDSIFGGVYDKIRIFDRCKENRQYLYLDLDIVINSKLNHLTRKEFTLLKAWWRPPFHTPLNSSIMSWHGDRSDIYKKFNSDPDYNIIKYNKGIDEFIFNEIQYDVYDKVCDCYGWPSDGNYSITLYSQNLEYMP